MNYIRYAEEFYEANNIDDINKKGFSRTLASFHLVDMYPSIKAMEKFSNEKKWTSLIKKSPDAAESAAIYLHFPFCNSFCSYCHLYKEIADQSGESETRYVFALKKEIETYARIFGNKLAARSIYFGGGTPSLMSVPALKEILSILKANFDVVKNCPISFEIYPSKNIDEQKAVEKLEMLKAFGAREIVLDQQSTNERSLEAIGRADTNFQNWKRIIGLISAVGNFRIKSSLILGLPYDDLKTFEQSVFDILSEKKLSTISLFLLEFRKGLKVTRDLAENKDAFCDARERDQMQIMARKILRDRGFRESPIHFYTRKNQNNQKAALIGSSAIHLLGFGPSAYGHIALNGREISYYNLADTARYEENLSKNALPISRIHYLTGKEIRTAELIDSLSSQGCVDIKKLESKRLKKVFSAFEKLGLTRSENEKVSLTELGKIRTEEMVWYLYDDNYRLLERKPCTDPEVLRHNYLTVMPKADERKYRQFAEKF